MHGMASDRHVMVRHGRIAAHRARRGAARRHPSEFRRKDYGTAGEQNPTPPDRETGCRFGKSALFLIRFHGAHPELGGSDFQLLQENSLCCKIQVDSFMPICIYCATTTGQDNHIQDTARYSVRRPLGKTFFFYNSCCRWRSVFLFI